MATIDDLTSATTALLDAVTDGKAALDLAVDQTSNNVTSINNMYEQVSEWVNDTYDYRNAASSFATTASNSAVTATARATESSQNATLSQTYRNQAQGYSITAEAAASSATASAVSADASADLAAASVASAVALPSTQATSTTSMLIGVGTQTITVETGKNFVPGMSIIVAAGTTPTANWVHGMIESYDDTTGVLVFVVDLVNGTGTFTSWIVSLSGPIGTNSVVLTGTPTAPTAAQGTNTTQLATTAFVFENAVTFTETDGSAVIPVGTTISRDLVPSAGYLRFNSDESRFEGYNGTEWKPVSSGSGIAWEVFASDVVTEAGKGILLNTVASPRTVSFHLNPQVGDIVAIADLKGSFNSNPATITTTGVVVHGQTLIEDILLDIANMRVEFVYTGAADGWIITQLT